jgi:glycosyltransferase involved in cell wall biosynthesis
MVNENKKRVLWWGRFDPGYSRNRVYISLFRKLGWEVDFFFVKVWPRFGDVEAFFRGLSSRPKPDLVWGPVARQRDIAAACRWARRRGIPVIFDPMISTWDKKVLEQKKWKAEERRSKKLLKRERRLMAMPDLVCWDTSCHVDFCAEYLKVPRQKLRVLLTGTDETVFKPQPPKPPHGGDFRVLYHGAYLPLHGTEYIVEAARMTEGKGIHWSFLGWGAYKAETEAKAAGISNITFLNKVPYTEVPQVICDHDVVLGVFGTTAKAARVIGNKVYECMACCRPTVNEFCTGYPPEAADCKAIKFIPPGDAAALVMAVEEYRADWGDRESYFAAAREFFEKHLSMPVIKKQLKEIVDDVLAAHSAR